MDFHWLMIITVKLKFQLLYRLPLKFSRTYRSPTSSTLTLTFFPPSVGYFTMDNFTPEKLQQASNVATAFAQHFYSAFDTNRSSLADLYVDNLSVLSFEGDVVVGKEAVMKKLLNLPFQSVQHVTSTVDGHPTFDGGVIVHVLGQLKADNDPAHGFSETFYLKANQGTFVILNDVFRLVIHQIAS